MESQVMVERPIVFGKQSGNAEVIAFVFAQNFKRKNS